MSAEANTGVVTAYVARLNEADLERTVFEEVVAAMKADLAVRKAEVDAIAHGYIGGREKQPSKAAGFAAVEGAFLERVRFLNKKKLIAKVAPW